MDALLWPAPGTMTSPCGKAMAQAVIFTDMGLAAKHCYASRLAAKG
jgi:hypothetical protein